MGKPSYQGITFPFFKSKLKFFKYRYLKLFKHYKRYILCFTFDKLFVFYILYLSISTNSTKQLHYLFHFGPNWLIRIVKSFANYCTTDNNNPLQTVVFYNKISHWHHWNSIPNVFTVFSSLKNCVCGKVRSIRKTIF